VDGPLINVSKGETNMSKGTAKTATRQGAAASTNERASTDQAAITLDGETRGKFVLFAIPAADRVEDGPVMRGMLETDQGKVNVAAWKKLARDTGNEYLSLKVGNAKRRDEHTPDGAPDEWLVGPFYGRLFKEVTNSRDSTRTRYFGFVEDSVKVGEDAKTHKGIYKTNWQVQIKAKPAVSNDGKTHYIDGSLSPAGAKVEASEALLPF
jgi:hypothetical protein